MIMRTLTPFFSLVIAGIIFVAFVQPQYAEVLSKREEIQQYANAIDTYAQFSRTLESKLALKTNMPAYKNERLDTLVPEIIDDSQLLVDLKSITQKHNMLFGNTKVTNKRADEVGKANDGKGNEVASSDLQYVDISFETIGTYDQFKEFLTDLENSLTLFEVIKITFSVSDSVFQQFELTVRTYSLPKM